MNRTPALLLMAILTLAVLAGLSLAWDAVPSGAEPRAEAFHRLVGGLGLGPALDLSACEGSFDPRLSSGCSLDCGPVAGGRCFCPYHACSVFDQCLDRTLPGSDPGPPPDAPLP
jgi:hypothetical protein